MQWTHGIGLGQYMQQQPRSKQLGQTRFFTGYNEPGASCSSSARTRPTASAKMIASGITRNKRDTGTSVRAVLRRGWRIDGGQKGNRRGSLQSVCGTLHATSRVVGRLWNGKRLWRQ